MAGGKRILIADDDPDIVDLLEAYYKKKGHEVSAATNGKDALQCIESGKFDLVLMDVMMPYIDGYHVTYEVTAKLGAEAPKIMLMEATSLSAWMKHPSASDICLEKYSGISFWGVMG